MPTYHASIVHVPTPGSTAYADTIFTSQEPVSPANYESVRGQLRETLQFPEDYPFSVVSLTCLDQPRRFSLGCLGTVLVVVTCIALSWWVSGLVD